MDEKIINSEDGQAVKENDKNTKKKSGRMPVVFMQIMAAVFLLVGIYLCVVSWNGYAATAASYELSMSQVLDAVIPGIISAGFPYLGFSCIFYGLSVVLEHQIHEKD